MDLEYVSKNAVVDRYVMDQLSEQEQVEFELYFLENPEILEEVELVRSLRRGLAAQRDQRLSKIDRIEDRGSIVKTIGSWFQSPVVLAVNFTVIAALAAIIILPSEAPTPLGFAAERVWIGEVRGSGVPLDVEVHSSSLVLDIDVSGPGTYDISLLDKAGQAAISIPQVVTHTDALLVVLKVATVASGNYSLEVTDSEGSPVLQRQLTLSMLSRHH